MRDHTAGLREPVSTPTEPKLAALLIEDDALDAAAFRRALPTLRVHWTRTLREGLDACGTERFDVIALDLGLPDSDGVATVEAARAVVDGRAPLVVLTGTGNESLHPALHEAGADYVLDKHEVNRLTLSDTIMRFIDEFRSTAPRQARVP